jgi:hypothetical protein
MSTNTCSWSDAEYRRRMMEDAAASASGTTCHENQCEAPPPAESAPECREQRSVEYEAKAAGYKSAGTQELVKKAAKRAPAPKPKAAPKPLAPAKPPTNSNQERTLATRPKVYAEAGKTSSGDAVYAGVALLKGRDKQGAAEVFSASGQVGAQNEVQVGMGRVTLMSKDEKTSARLQVFSARAAAGIHNEDGSAGWNGSVSASAVSADVTTHVGDVELHVGASLDGEEAGPGVSSHYGLRDPDHDGRYDVCVGVEASGVEVGLCLPNLI